MRTVLIGFFFVLVLPTLFTGCTDDPPNNDCFSYPFAPVTAVDGPSTGLANQDITMNVTSILTNGCGKFNGFETAVNNDTTIVKVKTIYQGCICTQVVAYPVKPYVFHPTSPGTYYFKYYQDGQTYLLDTLTIQ